MVRVSYFHRFAHSFQKLHPNWHRRTNFILELPCKPEQIQNGDASKAIDQCPELNEKWLYFLLDLLGDPEDHYWHERQRRDNFYWGNADDGRVTDEVHKIGGLN